MVSVEKYPCFCGAGLRRFESKDGRGFLKCKDEMCTLFNPGRPYFRCEETDADDKCDFFQWTDGKTKVKKSMKKKKRLETTAEEDLCCREAEESDETYKTTSII